LNLASVLHFLQTEWRRYERDRNEWEIERAEMRARIALLEGQRRSFENVKLDHMRRIKMLEYALRVERSKQLTQSASSLSTQSKGTSSNKDDAGSGAPKQGSGSSSPGSPDSPVATEARLPATVPNGVAPPAAGPASQPDATRPQTWSGTNWAPSSGGPNGVSPAGSTNAALLGKPQPGRDPKSRARSREYLKQCLLEVSYLTSPQAMNPLPNRPIVGTGNTGLPAPPSLPNLPTFGDPVAFNGRPRKLVPEVGKDFPNLNGVTAVPNPGIQSLQAEKDKDPFHDKERGIPDQRTSEPVEAPVSTSSANTLAAAAEVSQPISQQDQSSTEENQLTAIFRPDSAGSWRIRLRNANEAAKSAKGKDDELMQLSAPTTNEDDEEDSESVVSEGSTGNKIWRTKRTLRNHLDAVRAVVFYPNDLSLATAGDDCTVKIWRMDVNNMTSTATRPTTEIEPQVTMRGHTSAVTRLVTSHSKRLLYSASLDSTIRIWSLPPATHTTYAPFDSARSRGVLVGHTDSVWGLTLLKDRDILISCGAEGATKVWDVSAANGQGNLKSSWGYNGLGGASTSADAVSATAVEGLKTDLKTVAVAYRDSIVKLFDVETGKEVNRLKTDLSYDGTPATQINSIVSHPTMSLLVTAHEDKFIRIFDTSNGQCIHSMPAHLDAVTSLSIDSSGFSLVSGSHDCSVRFWDILNTRACVQEITTHRKKADEGVLDVQYHSSLPFFASAGADGIVKVYSSS
jgi:striatin 1/3/4